MRGVVTNGATQGLAIATGLQKKFDWTGLATAGAVSGAFGIMSRSISGQATGNPFSADGSRNLAVNADGVYNPAGYHGPSATNSMISGAVSGLAGGGVRSLITGTSFGDNILAVLPDVIGNVVGTIGARAASGVVERTVAAAKANAPMLKVDKDAYGLDDDTVTGGRTTTSAVQNSSYRDTITKMGIASLPGPAKYALARMASDAANMGEIEVQAPYHRGKLARTSNLATKGMSFIDEPEENITPSVENAHGMHASTSIKIKSAEQARAVIAEWRAVFAEYGMQDNGFEILVGLKTRELMWDVKEGVRKTDDLIPFQLVTLEEQVGLLGKIPLVKDSIEQAAYLSILATDGPGPRPETDWLWSPWQTTKQQVKYDIALKFHETYQAKVGNDLPVSPIFKLSDLTGKTRTEIRQFAQLAGLVVKGDTNHPDFPRKYYDPLTGQPRIRLDRGHVDPKTGLPYRNPNAAVDHIHAYDTRGNSIKFNNDKHIPTIGE